MFSKIENEITYLYIPNSVTEIGQFVFTASGLTKITIPDSVTTISKNAFDGCLSLESVTFKGKKYRYSDKSLPNDFYKAVNGN